MPDNVEMKAVVIWSEGTRLAGDLYFPKGWTKGDKLPVIVCCNGWGGTKQNTTGRVAVRFAQRGYVALAFDYRGWGDSDSKLVLKDKMPKPDEKGEVTVKAQAIREVVDPFDEALDIRHAIDYVVGEPGVDRERIGLWGSSYGGGLVTWTAARDDRVKCVVAQVAAMGFLSAATRKRAEERATQQARGEIGPIPQDYDKPPNLRGYGNLAKMIGYNALEASAKVKVPILFIDAEKEELFNRLQHAKKAHEVLVANKVPSEYHIIKGITHYGIYREGFEEATKLALGWFDAHLKRRGSSTADADKERTFRFAKDDVGKLPAGWKAAHTGKGDGSVWKVVADETGPAKTGYVLAQTAESPNAYFNICVIEDSRYSDVDIRVRFKAIRGKNDQGGGIVWRYADGDNYYIARMNPLEDNYRVYKVVAGKRIQLETKEDLKVPAGEWHALRVTHKGNHIECYLDGTKHLDAKDDMFKEVGKVGLWTKSDAQTYFDDLQVK